MPAGPVDLAALPDSELSVSERLLIAGPDLERELLAGLSDDELAALEFDWTFWGRPDQQFPAEPWRILFMEGGRGSGKSITAVQLAHQLAMQRPRETGAFIAPTPKDARDYLIESRDSGILHVVPPSERPIWEPTKLKLTWPNGAEALIRTAAEPEAIRGPNFGWALCEELAKWKFLQDAWDNLRLSLRSGINPKTIISSTPKPYPLIRELDSGLYKNRIPVEVRRISTYRNAANLAPDFLLELLAAYEGTRIGMQELHGMILEDVEGAAWTYALIEGSRITETPSREQMRRVAVGVDPAASTGTHGIVVDAIDYSRPPRGWTLDDRSLKGSPDEWARAAIGAYHDWEADAIVAEVNNGGDMVADVIQTRDPHVRVEKVRATRGKKKRAEPIVALYEQGRWQHVGAFAELEMQMTTWTEEDGDRWSPDRMDAHVWAATWLAVGSTALGVARAGSPVGATLPRTRPRRG